MTIHTSEHASSSANGVMKVERPFYQQQELNTVLDYNNSKDGKKPLCSNPMSKFNPLKILQSIFPILTWLPQYDFKKDLISDIISGSTVSVMQIPQGLHIFPFLFTLQF